MIRKPDADSGSSAHQICACPSSAGQQEKEKRKKEQLRPQDQRP